MTNDMAVLDSAIAADPTNLELRMQRGRYYYGAGEFGKALNDFMKALEIDPESVGAQEYITIINEILAFRHTDTFNP